MTTEKALSILISLKEVNEQCKSNELIKAVEKFIGIDEGKLNAELTANILSGR